MPYRLVILRFSLSCLVMALSSCSASNKIIGKWTHDGYGGEPLVFDSNSVTVDTANVEYYFGQATGQQSSTADGVLLTQVPITYDVSSDQVVVHVQSGLKTTRIFTFNENNTMVEHYPGYANTDRFTKIQ